MALRRAATVIAAVAVALGALPECSAQAGSTTPGAAPAPPSPAPQASTAPLLAATPRAAPARPVSLKPVAAGKPRSASRYRGWDFLVSRLKERGVQERDLVAIYQNPRMPKFTFIPFNLAPREKPSLYRNFTKPSFVALGAAFVRDNAEMFGRMEELLKVPPEVVAAILVIESGIGKNTGKELIVYRLSRLASVCEPSNLRRNYLAQRKKDPSVSFQDVVSRCQYLESTFLPEIPALIEIGRRNNVAVIKVQGSSAGAFGLPQFLPSAFIRFGLDGNRDGTVSLYHPDDAAWSAANYLSSYGYRADSPVEERRAVIWRYNKSDAYIDAVLALSAEIRRELDTPILAVTPTPGQQATATCASAECPAGDAEES